MGRGSINMAVEGHFHLFNLFLVLLSFEREREAAFLFHGLDESAMKKGRENEITDPDLLT